MTLNRNLVLYGVCKIIEPFWKITKNSTKMIQVIETALCQLYRFIILFCLYGLAHTIQNLMVNRLNKLRFSSKSGLLFLVPFPCTYFDVDPL